MKKLLVIALSFFPFIGLAQWVQQNLGTAVNLNAVFCQNDTVAYVTEDNGYMLKTIDGGVNWDTIGPQVFSGPLWFTSVDTGYAVGIGGVLKTVDGGLNWVDNFTESVPVGEGVIHFPTKNIGYAQFENVTYDSILIFRTTDAGLSWNRTCAFETLGVPGSIFFTNATTGFIVANMDGIYKTTDSGSNWVKKLNSGDLYSVFFPSDLIGYAVGDSFFKTTDGGNTWNFQNNPNSSLFYSVHFTDNNTGYAVGGDGFTTGMIVKTTDGGTNWGLSLSGTYTFSSVNFQSAITGYVCGQGGKIYKYSLSSGIKNYNEINSLTVYPNPGNGNFNLSIENFNKSAKIFVLDVFGNVMQQIEINNQILNIDIAGQPKGIYFVKVEDSQRVRMKKIVYQ